MRLTRRQLRMLIVDTLTEAKIKNPMDYLPPDLTPKERENIEQLINSENEADRIMGYMLASDMQVPIGDDMGYEGFDYLSDLFWNNINKNISPEYLKPNQLEKLKLIFNKDIYLTWGRGYGYYLPGRDDWAISPDDLMDMAVQIGAQDANALYEVFTDEEVKAAGWVEDTIFNMAKSVTYNIESEHDHLGTMAEAGLVDIKTGKLYPLLLPFIKSGKLKIKGIDTTGKGTDATGEYQLW